MDLASYAYQIWKNAIDRDPELEKTIPSLPNVVYSTRPHSPTDSQPEGVLVYLRTADGNDALAWMDKKGNSVTESQFTILKAAECPPDTPALPRLPDHHALVKKGVELIVQEEKNIGGQLGRPSGARFRCYERLKRYAEESKGTLFEHDPIYDDCSGPLRKSTGTRSARSQRTSSTASFAAASRMRTWPGWSSTFGKTAACAWFTTMRNRRNPASSVRWGFRRTRTKHRGFGRRRVRRPSCLCLKTRGRSRLPRKDTEICS